MSYDIKDFLKKFFSSRLFVLAAVFIVFFGIILARIFTLQVVNGKSYQENFSLKIQMKQPINAARGNIYDKNGKLLAYNELAYSISINDSTTYSSTKEKNKAVNAELAEILTVLKNNGETLNNDFKIDRKKDGTYSFNVSGSSLNRFRADVFGKGSADDLEYDKETGKTSVQKVDTELYTGWIEGMFVFRNQRLEDVMSDLARWYNMTIFYSTAETKEIRISTNLNRYKNIDDLLEIINESGKVVAARKDNTITIHAR